MSETPTPTRRPWFQFSLQTLIVVVTLVAIFIAAFGGWAIFIAVLAGVEIALGAATVGLGKFADRLEGRGQKFAAFVTRVASTLPILLALVLFLAALGLYSISQVHSY